MGFPLLGCAAHAPTDTPRVQNVSGESAARSEQMSEVVFVVPLEGAPAQTALILADAIAAEIRDSNHPAILAYEPNQMGASVVGKVVTADQRGNVIWLTIEWAIRAPYGTHVASYQQHVVIDAGMWQNAAPEAINLLIGDAAPKVAEMVNAQVGPATFAAMRRPDDVNTRAPEQAMIKSPQMSNPETIQPMGPKEVPSAPLSQPLARIAERTNGQVVMSPAASSAMPSPPEPEAQPVKLRAPTGLPSLLEQTPTPASSPPRALTPGAVNVAPPPGGTTQTSDEDKESFLEQLKPNMDAVDRRAGDARPAGQGGAAFSKVRWGQPSFLIKPVRGAPGNGNEALTAALKTALRGRDLTISEDPRQAGFVIQGVVDTGEPVSGRQYIRIIWRVDTVTGDEVGKAVQENTVIAGSLDGEWGHVAEVVSNAAVRGIKDLFGEADERISGREPLPEFPDVQLPAVPGRAPPPPSSY